MGTEKTTTVEIPNRLVNRMLDHVDGIRYLDIGHLAKTAILDWLDYQEEINFPAIGARIPTSWPGPARPKPKRPAKKKAKAT